MSDNESSLNDDRGTSENTGDELDQQGKEVQQEHCALKSFAAHCVVLMREFPDATDEELTAKIQQRISVDAELAARLIEFVPEGYARAYYWLAKWDLVFEDKYRRATDEGGFTEYYLLAHEHVFGVSLGLAAEEIQEGVPQHLLDQIIRRSSIAKQLESAIATNTQRGTRVMACTFYRRSEVPCDAGYNCC